MIYETLRERSSQLAIILALIFGYLIGLEAFAAPAAVRLENPASLGQQLEGAWRLSQLQPANCAIPGRPCPHSASERAYTAPVLEFRGGETQLRLLVCNSSTYERERCQVTPICEDPVRGAGPSFSELLDCQNTRNISAKIRLEDACRTGHQGEAPGAEQELEDPVRERRTQVCQSEELKSGGGFQLVVTKGHPFPYHGTFFRLDASRRLLMEALPLFMQPSASSQARSFEFDELVFLRL